MNATTLKSKLDELGVNPPDRLRAALYLAQLEQAAAVFKVDLSKEKDQGGFGSAYEDVKPALVDPILLSQLAEILDTYVMYAVIADLIAGEKMTKQADEKKTIEEFLQFQKRGDGYRQYFQEKIFGISEPHFQKNLEDFYGEYPRAKYAIEKLTSNFISNIKRACTRVIKDWKAIDTVFAKPQKGELRKLKMIKPSGSDFHKGGQQVLFLTFKVFERMALVYKELKLVYKPADVEADCLLIGDSAAVNSVHPGFMTKSLMEILNAWIELERQSNTGATLVNLPTYKILPFTYGTSKPTPEIKDSYGYLEFLHHEEIEKIPGTAFSSPSVGPGDFVIRPAQDKGAICRKFYCLIGQTCALATTFSLGDLHCENLIAHQYLPCLIDLENSLSKPMANIKATGLLMKQTARDRAAITGIHGQTRLMIEEGSVKKRVEPKKYARTLMSGLQQMLTLMGKNVQSADIVAWFTRLNGVIVRQVPISTEPLGKKLKALFSYEQCGRPMESFDADITAQIQPLERLAFNYWTGKIREVLGQNLGTFKDWGVARQQSFWKSKIFPDPIFFAFSDTYFRKNYRDLDVPVFYHRVGGNDLLNYDGQRIPIGPSTYVLQAHYDEFLKWVGNDQGERLTYFPLCFTFPKSLQSYPTEFYIKLLQFDKLADATYLANQIKKLTEEIRQELAEPTSEKALQQLKVVQV
jgi:hypothetical protein